MGIFQCFANPVGWGGVKSADAKRLRRQRGCEGVCVCARASCTSASMGGAGMLRALNAGCPPRQGVPGEGLTRQAEPGNRGGEGRRREHPGTRGPSGLSQSRGSQRGDIAARGRLRAPGTPTPPRPPQLPRQVRLHTGGAAQSEPSGSPPASRRTGALRAVTAATPPPRGPDAAAASRPRSVGRPPAPRSPRPAPAGPASSRKEPPTARRVRGQVLPGYRLGDLATNERSGKSGPLRLPEEVEPAPEVGGAG